MSSLLQFNFRRKYKVVIKMKFIFNIEIRMYLKLLTDFCIMLPRKINK